jgi:predicted amidohydrolase YtcJ
MARALWIAACSAILMMATADAQTRPQATLYFGGPIVTMDGPEPATVQAVAIRNGRIVAVGSLAQVRRRVGPRARRINLSGRTLLPGFIDAHGHISGVGWAADLARLSPSPLGAVDSIAALQEELRRYIRERNIPNGAIVMGFGYDDSQMLEHRHPTRQDLDAVSANHLIAVSHASGHLGAMNSAMLARAGITAASSDPPGGVIRREADGRTPNGVLEENAHFAAQRSLAPQSIDAGVDALMRGEAIYAANGITTTQDGFVSPQLFALLAEASRRSVLRLDMVALLSLEAAWPEAVRQRIGAGYESRLRVAGMKIIVDGSPQGRTAWLRAPVHRPPEGRGADYTGFPAIEPAALEARLSEAAANGWQVFAHVNGDLAAQALIDAVSASGLAGRRTIAIHNQVVGADQLQAMRSLDIHPSFFASHTWYWGDWHRDVALGPERADRISPQRTAAAMGLVVSAHNDSPVAPPDIMRLIWCSVNRRTQSGDILGPAERVDVYQALRQVTVNAAWQIHEEDSKGMLRAGYRADFVILDRNPLATPPDELDDIDVVATIKDGALVHGRLN